MRMRLKLEKLQLAQYWQSVQAHFVFLCKQCSMTTQPFPERLCFNWLAHSHGLRNLSVGFSARDVKFLNLTFVSLKLIFKSRVFTYKYPETEAYIDHVWNLYKELHHLEDNREKTGPKAYLLMCETWWW